MADTEPGHIVLPRQIVSSVDLSRITRELEALNDSLYQAELRKPGEPTKLAKSSPLLEELAHSNGVKLTDATHRTQLLELLHALQEHSPHVHMSVANEPSGEFLQQVITWMRANIHPTILLNIGLQPTLIAGCRIRTRNKMFDMSLRQHFAENRSILVQKLRGDEASE